MIYQIIIIRFATGKIKKYLLYFQYFPLNLFDEPPCKSSKPLLHTKVRKRKKALKSLSFRAFIIDY